MAHGALTPIIGLRLLALAAGLRHNAEIGQPGLCFSAYGHKFGINHLVPPSVENARATAALRVRTSSFSRMCSMCFRTVCGETTRIAAISLVVLPSAIRPR